jgi:hypothetical protein
MTHDEHFFKETKVSEALSQVFGVMRAKKDPKN